MAAAYASLVSLMNIIRDIEHHPPPSISIDKQLLDSITQHITFFLEFLHDYNNNRPPPVPDHDEDTVDPLEMRIAGAAYAAEDAIESHIVETILQQRIHYDEEEDEYCLGNIKYMCRLESLNLIIEDDQAAYNKLTFPQSLKKLHISLQYFSVEWDGSVVLENIAGSLPLLEKLKLWNGHFKKGKWETAEGQFPCLKYLELDYCQGLENWTAKEDGSNILPRLEHLHLVFMVDLMEIPCELGNIDTVKRIELINCGEGAVKCAKEMVDEQIDLQGQLSFHVDVQITDEDQEHLLSLAGPNFVVRHS